MKSNLVLKSLNSPTKITEMGQKILIHLKETISDLRQKLPLYKSKIPNLLTLESNAVEKLQNINQAKPTVISLPDPRYAGWMRETDEYKNWKVEVNAAEKDLQDKTKRVQSTRAKIFKAENDIILCVSQAACFSRLFHDEAEDGDCQLCAKKALDLEVTTCNHSFCGVCILNFVRRNSHCPVCNTSLQIHDISSSSKSKKKNQTKDVKKGKKEKENDRYLDIRNDYGTKISAIIKSINEILSSDPTYKIIVFSKWDNLLSTLGDILDQTYEEETGGQPIYVSCKGNVIVKNKMIQQFNNMDENSPRVLFLSLTSAASGTHLTVASHIILVDPPAGTKEEAIAYDSQAIARSHRIGQEKQVVVLRFIMENTIDHDDYLKAYGGDL